jgi:purine-binding chemotaxis protein CheW
MNQDSQLYCTFRVAEGWFGVPIEDVKEITAQTTCTRIPHAPQEVAGYVSIRGQIILALDLRRLLGFAAKTDSDNRLIIFKQSVGPAFGILVDEIADIVPVQASLVEEYRAGIHERSAGKPIERRDLIARVCRLPAELLVILDPRKFLRQVEQLMAPAL